MQPRDCKQRGRWWRAHC